jgi:uncharacterized repeat protein (TIGR03843 family)
VIRRPPPDPALVDRLRTAPLDVLGRMPWASNGTFLVQLADEEATDALGTGTGTGTAGPEAPPDAPGEAPTDDTGASDDDGACRPPRGIYKPRRGERPLWDFPPGLYKREAAAFELAVALEWWVVPPTVVREGPLGEGSVQLFIDADFEQHYFTLQEEREYRWDFQAICLFDLVANNTDRKSGHCLLGPDGRIWAIDNGLCFAEEFKLRTVLWDFAGEPIPDDLLADLARLVDDGPPDALARLLDDDEQLAMLERADSLVRSARFPVDRTGRRYPWPLV